MYSAAVVGRHTERVFDQVWFTNELAEKTLRVIFDDESFKTMVED